jgi:hypothetical protein
VRLVVPDRLADFLNVNGKSSASWPAINPSVNTTNINRRTAAEEGFPKGKNFEAQHLQARSSTIYIIPGNLKSVLRKTGFKETK